jgi:cytochrome c oxidase subunit 4
MTGMHAVHMIIGEGMLLWLLICTLKGRFTCGLLCTRGDHRFVLALRGHRVDIPLPHALLDWQALMTTSQHHIVPLRVYLAIITILFLLTILTVWVAFQDFGIFNNLVALTIAVIKALLVVMFFMHLKYSARILWLYAGAGAVWFIIMLALLLSDYASRDWLTRPQPWETPPAISATATPPGGAAH